MNRPEPLNDDKPGDGFWLVKSKVTIANVAITGLVPINPVSAPLGAPIPVSLSYLSVVNPNFTSITPGVSSGQQPASRTLSTHWGLDAGSRARLPLAARRRPARCPGVAQTARPFPGLPAVGSRERHHLCPDRHVTAGRADRAGCTPTAPHHAPRLCVSRPGEAEAGRPGKSAELSARCFALAALTGSDYHLGAAELRDQVPGSRNIPAAQAAISGQ